MHLIKLLIMHFKHVDIYLEFCHLPLSPNILFIAFAHNSKQLCFILLLLLLEFSSRSCIACFASLRFKSRIPIRTSCRISGMLSRARSHWWNFLWSIIWYKWNFTLLNNLLLFFFLFLWFWFFFIHSPLIILVFNSLKLFL